MMTIIMIIIMMLIIKYYVYFFYYFNDFLLFFIGEHNGFVNLHVALRKFKETDIKYKNLYNTHIL